MTGRKSIVVLLFISLGILVGCGSDKGTLKVSQRALTINYPGGGVVPVTQLTVTSVGSPLRYKVSSSASWLKVSATSGATAGKFTVTASPTGMAVGSYTGTVTVTSPTASNGPQHVAVTFKVSNGQTTQVTTGTGQVSIFVPPAALIPTLPPPTISVTSSSTPPAGAPSLPITGTVYTLTKDQTENFLVPAIVTVPYDPTTNPLPTVLYWDSTNQQYESAAVVSIDPVAKTVSFRVVHFSPYVVAGHGSYNTTSPLLTQLDTGFVPLTDSFFLGNFGSFTAPGGSSLGMSDFALWYYKYEKSLDSNNLYNGTAGLYNKYRTDLDTEKRLISQAQNAAAANWNYRWNGGDPLAVWHAGLDQKQTGLMLLANMALTNSPQVLIMEAYDSNHVLKSAKAVMVYKFVPDNVTTPVKGVFYLYDPNYPGEVVTLAWDNSASDDWAAFSGYSKAAAYSVPFTDYVFDGLSATASAAQFKTLFGYAEGSQLLGSIAVTSPTVTNSVANIQATTTTLPDVTVTATITPLVNITAPKYAICTVNGKTYFTQTLQGNMTITCPILGRDLLASGNIVTLTATSDLYDPWNIAAFTSFTLNFTGQTVNSFVNAGFEDQTWAPWTVETHFFDPHDYDGHPNDTIRDTTGSPFPKISASPDCTNVDANFCYRRDTAGNYYSPVGTPNPDYNPSWGQVTSFIPNTAPNGKSALVQSTELDSFFEDNNDVAYSTYTSKEAGVDPIVDYYLQNGGTALATLNMVFNGSQALRVNNSDYDFHSSSASQTAVIPLLANPQLKFAWAAVLEDPGHPMTDQPFVDVAVYDNDAQQYLYHVNYLSGNPTYSGWIPLVNSSGYGITPNGSAWNVIPWQVLTLDVSSARGHSVTITVIAADCNQGGHGGYAYLDDAP